MKLFVKDKTFYKSFFSMTAILALQNVITFAVNLADNVMIGGYSQTALSGVAMVNQIQFLLQMLMLGTGNAIGVLGSQYWGKKELRPVRKVTSIGLLLGLVFSVIMTVVVYFFPKEVLSLLTNEQEVIEEGSKYLVIICFSYVLFAVSNNLLSALRSVETVKIGFVVNLVALVINVILNYGLIYGNLGMPKMGVEGAAVATLAARVAEFLVVVIYALFFDKKICWKPKDLLRIDMLMFRDYIRVGLPVILANAVWGVAMGVQTAILGRLGEDAIAANSIATTIFQVVSVLVYAGGNATAVLIGKTVGEGDIPRVKAYSKTLQILFLIIGAVCGLLLFFSRDFIVGLYDVTAGAERLSHQFIMVLSVTIVGTGYQCSCLTGIVTGGGDTKFVLINDLIHQWLIVIPASFLSAFVFGWPLWVTFLCLKSDQILKCAVAVVKVNRYRWIHQLTRTENAEK